MLPLLLGHLLRVLVDDCVLSRSDILFRIFECSLWQVGHAWSVNVCVDVRYMDSGVDGVNDESSFQRNPAASLLVGVLLPKAACK